MKIFDRFKAAVLVPALIFCTAFSMPVRAAQEQQDDPIDPYNMEIQSNSWENWPAGPQVYAESAIVMEASTGTILYSKNMDDRHYPASITKVMTALLTLENAKLDEEVTFSHYAVYSIEYGSSSIARDEGEILTVEECLYGLLLESGNDCANALAEHVGGSVEGFAEMMNQKAAELGCTNTHFVNPHGLHDENHYTSAHDMALITQAAIRNEKFRQISGTARYTLRATNKKDQELIMYNHHYMICGNKTTKFLDDTVFAGKNGYTTDALNTLVTCATRNGMDLIVVTMRTQGSGQLGIPLFSDTANLLNYAGENFHKVNVSQNETNFTIGQNELFNTGNSVFGTSTPMIEMDPDSYIVLPVSAEFSDASPELEFLDNDDSNSIAVLNYTYAGQQVGSARLLVSEDSIQEFDFHDESASADDADAAQDDAGTGQPSAVRKQNFIKINLRVVGIIVCILLLILIIALLVHRISKDYQLNLPNLSSLRRWRRSRPDRNSFSDQNRKRYRSRKRRRKKW